MFSAELGLEGVPGQGTPDAGPQPPPPSAWWGPSATSSAPSSQHLDSSPFSPFLQPSLMWDPPLHRQPRRINE